MVWLDAAAETMFLYRLKLDEAVTQSTANCLGKSVTDVRKSTCKVDRQERVKKSRDTGGRRNRSLLVMWNTRVSRGVCVVKIGQF